MWAIRSRGASRRRSRIRHRTRERRPTRHTAPDHPDARTSTEFKTQRPIFADQDLERRLEEKGVVDQGHRRERLIVVQAAGRLRPHAAADRRLRLDQRPRRGRSRWRAVRPRPQPRQALQRGAAEGHLRRCRGDRRGRERADRDRRLPEEPGQVPAPRRHRAEGRAADRCARNRQDAAGAGDCRAGGRALLQPQRLRVHRDDRRRRRRRACATCSSRRGRRRRRSSSSTNWTPSAARAGAARSSADTTSASRR